MQNIDVVYLYEHVARELDVACAVKCIAEQHYGIRIQLVQYPTGVPRALSQFRPRVVALPFCYTEHEYSDLCLLDWRKSVCFNVAWEQLLYHGNREAKTPRGEFSCKHVIHHAWGDFFCEYLQERGIPKEHIFVNGNPAYMLYEEPYRQYFDQRSDLASKHQIDPAKRWIFFPENYNWAFYPEGKLKSFIRQGQHRDEVFAMRHFCHLSLEEVIKWCGAVASHDNVELIIRPRPNIPFDDFRSVVQRIIPAIPERMHFIKDGSIREWIMASDVVISSYSTSLIEAAVVGKTAYMLEPYPIPGSLYMDWHDLIPHINTQSEFQNACLKCHEGGANNRLGIWARTTMMARGDAIWSLADFLARLCMGEIRHPPFATRRSATSAGRFPLPAWFLFEYRRIRWKKKRRIKPSEISVGHEKDVLDPNEVEQRVNRWKRVLADYTIDKNKRDAPSLAMSHC